MPGMDGPVYIAAKAHSLTVSLAHRHIYAFDRVGRLLYAFRAGVGYKRSLDNRLLERRIHPGRSPVRNTNRELGTAARRRFFTELACDLQQARQELLAGRAHTPGLSDRTVVSGWLHRCQALDFAALEAEARLFRRIYRPVGILPPDQYLSVVLQATEGCAYNRCTFCSFYRERPHRVKGLAEFKAHVAAVKDFFGASLQLRRRLFLADANALSVGQADLEAMFAAIWTTFDRREVDGIYSFLDMFTGIRRDVADFQALAGLGLQRVYLGVETGAVNVLRLVRKPGSPELARELVERLHAAGVQVGVIVMAGLGGERFAREHVHSTVALLQSMRLNPRDILYVSPFVPAAGSEYAEVAAVAGVRPLPAHRVQEQMQALRAAVAGGTSPPRIAPYDIRDFVY